MTGLHYPDNLYADHEEAKARRLQQPTGAYRSTDPVTKPAHYQRAGIETIDYIRATLDGPGFEAYCIGNVLKYVSRYREKGGAEDLRKAQVYLGWAIEPDAPKRGSVVVHPPGVAPPGSWPRFNEVGHETMRVPKWDPAWGKAPNCDGLSARDIKGPEAARRDLNGYGTVFYRYEMQDGRLVVTHVPLENVYVANSGHPMQAEAIRDHDERLSGAEDRL